MICIEDIYNEQPALRQEEWLESTCLLAQAVHHQLSWQVHVRRAVSLVSPLIDQKKTKKECLVNNSGFFSNTTFDDESSTMAVKFPRVTSFGERESILIWSTSVAWNNSPFYNTISIFHHLVDVKKLVSLFTGLCKTCTPASRFRFSHIVAKASEIELFPGIRIIV